MHKNVTTDFLMSISFSVFGMLLIFGLGFVFPTINPYVVIKWIIIISGAVFLYSFLKYFGFMIVKSRAMKMMKSEETAPAIKVSKAKKAKK